MGKSPFIELPVQLPELRGLYARLGKEKIEAILKDFYRRMEQDILVGFFFRGKDVDQIAERQLQFLLRAMGATPSYSGKPPASAHSELAPILSGHFDRRLKLLEETLVEHGLSAEDIRTWIGFENAFREGIVSTS
jgi:hemoglobin